VWLYPSTNGFVAEAGLAGITSATVNGVSVANARLTSTSAYFRAGTGGSTPGADLTAVESATAGVVQP
ncbi:hypothetical protein, partial [Roseisolibacter agri]|uniref:hypothetical protein n=1 Tax=Roseisolibacter agri TaxID=2014610 RepID=UPI0024E0AA02